MSQSSVAVKSEEVKKPIQILRQRRGGVSKQLTALVREQTKLRKQLTKALEDSPKTVPEVSRITDIPTHKVFWYLMGMKKYGTVVEGEEREGYFEYALKKEKE